VPALLANRVLFELGVPVAVHAGGQVHFLKDIPEVAQWEIRNRLVRRQVPQSYVPEPPAPH